MGNKKNIVTAVVITAVITAGLTSSAFLYALGFFSFIPSFGGGYVNTAKSVIKEAFYKEVDDKILDDGAVAGMMSALGDDYSYYLDEKSFKDLQSSLEGEYTGIGVEVTIDPEDNLITVITPIDDTPAAKGGISTGDKIINVNATAVSADNYADAIMMMRGTPAEVGQDINLIIKKKDTGTDINVTLKREKIVLKTIKSKMLENNTGYIRISRFDNNTDKEFKSAFEDLKSQGLDRLVIDLRNNPGGVFEACKNIGELLMPEGLFASFEYKDGEKKDYFVDDDYDDIKVSILINEGSASASEVLAAAMSESGRAVIVGVKSFGKGVVQNVYPINSDMEGNSAAIYITTCRWLTPSGKCIHGEGIAPDIEIDLPEKTREKNIAALTEEEDVQLKEAVKAIKQ